MSDLLLRTRTVLLMIRELCRVIQQRAGEWLLRQLDQMKENDTAISLKADKTLNVEGEQR